MGNETTMGERGGKAAGVYLYAVLPKDGAPPLGEGIEQAKVYTVAEGPLTAVVSDLAEREEGGLRPERRNLAAHQGVLKRVLENSPMVLPVSFGTVADGAEGVKTLLRKYQQQFLEQLERVKGRVQMTLHLRYAVETPGVFDYLMEKYNPELGRRRDELFGEGRVATREEKIEFGQAIERLLEASRDELAGVVEEGLGDRCAATKRLALRNERELVRLACLIDGGARAAFDAAVDEVARRFDEHFALDENGPFPAYDFTELHLQV